MNSSIHTVLKLCCALSLVCTITLAVTINDVSKLNLTHVARIEHPNSIEQLRAIVAQAKRDGLKVIASGKRHSQGGHAFYDNAVVIDMLSLNAIINFDRETKTITVQPGTTWQQIQDFLNPHGLALQVMQTANIFTVGGSLSVNCHGRDPNYGPLIETIKGFRILLANGSIVHASRQENYELFKLVIGGYGLFGIITEVDITLTDNCLYKQKTAVMTIDEYQDFVENNIVGNKEVGLHYGQLSTAPHAYLEELYTTTYTKTGECPPHVFDSRAEQWIDMNKLRLTMRRKFRLSNMFGGFNDWLLAHVNTSFSPVVCRNNAMRHPVECLEYNSVTDTDILQSYFIPTNKFVVFMNFLRELIKKRKINMLHVLTRYIPKNTESFLHYTNDNYFEIVLFITIKQAPDFVDGVKRWTQRLVDFVLDCGGCYYLPTQLFPTGQQLKRAYSMIDNFFAKKLEYDSQELFINNFYMKYACQK